jgi:membrane-associated HD superfamily phosphohydrolase
MALFGKKTARQKEIRRSKAERRPLLYQQVLERVRPQPLLLLLACAVAGAVIVNLGDDVLTLQDGERVPRAITSRVALLIEDEPRTQVLRIWARDNAEDYYTLDVSLLQDIRGRLTSLLRIAREQGEDTAALRQAAAAVKIELDEAGAQEILRIAGTPDGAGYAAAVDRALQALRRTPLVEAKEDAARRTGVSAILVDPGPGQATERPISVNDLLFNNKQESVVQAGSAAAAAFPPELRPSIGQSIANMLASEDGDAYRPLYRYDRAASAAAAAAAEQAVPTQYVEYAVGSRLADAGPLTREELELLEQEYDQYLAARHATPELRNRHQQAVAARAVIAFLVIFGLGGYIMVYRERTTTPLHLRFVTALTLLGVLALTRLAYLQTPTPYLAVGAQAFAVTLLAITSRRAAAQAAGALLALMITLATRESVGFIIVLAATSVVLFFGLRDVRHRGRIIAVGMVAALVALAMTLLVGLIGGQTLSFIFWQHALWAGLTTLGAAFLVEGVLPAIERLFGVTTNLTLLEWCDPNKPLMRMLAAESPGRTTTACWSVHAGRRGGGLDRGQRPAGPRGGVLPRHRQDQQARVLRREPGDGRGQSPRAPQPGDEPPDHHRPRQGRHRDGQGVQPAGSCTRSSPSTTARASSSTSTTPRTRRASPAIRRCRTRSSATPARSRSRARRRS